jgi:hypothetical protein
VKNLVVYEPPFALDGTHMPSPADFREQIANMRSSNRRVVPVKLFMRVVGVSSFGIFFVRLLPNVWPKLRAVAHTLPYDFAVLGETQSDGPLPRELADKLGAINVPTLALAGGKSPPWMHHASKKIAETVTSGAFPVVPGQDHNVSAKAMAPVITEFMLAP